MFLVVLVQVVRTMHQQVVVILSISQRGLPVQKIILSGVLALRDSTDNIGWDFFSLPKPLSSLPSLSL